jgi:hypothetical protein
MHIDEQVALAELGRNYFVLSLHACLYNTENYCTTSSRYKVHEGFFDLDFLLLIIEIGLPPWR